MRTGPYALVAVYALLTACGSAIGEDSQELAAALGRSILPPGQAVREVKVFVQQRIIAPPTLTLLTCTGRPVLDGGMRRCGRQSHPLDEWRQWLA